ncbi:MAG: galactokinase [Rhodothermales bacterium]|nr:galactokinase [Rhodothermales bacterium]
MTDILEALRNAWSSRFADRAPTVCVRAPGRVNLIGDHTDYNDGFVLPVTLEQAVYVLAAPRADRHVRLYALNLDREASFDLDAAGQVGSTWRHYVSGVVAEVNARTPLPHGFDAVIYGDVPLGSGLSSSAAIEVASLLALQAVYGLDVDPVEGALLCQRVEHRWIGLQCGIMDQFASRLGRAGHALFLDCRSLQYQEIPMALGDAALLIIDSKAPRSLASSKYNERRGECEAGVEILRRLDPSIASLRDVSLDLLARHEAALPAVIFRRCRHVVSENARVEAAATALRAGDLPRLGALMSASHASLRDDYAVSSSALDRIVDTALDTEGVYGARLTGAGFGGCVVALVEARGVPAIQQQIGEAYRQAFLTEAEFYQVRKNVEAGRVRM